MKKLLISAIVLASLLGCSTGKVEKEEVVTNLSYDELVKKAKAEGTINTVGMPDLWANWGGTWSDLEKQFSISSTDTDMSSAEEIAKVKADGKKGTVDMGDVGQSFCPVVIDEGISLPYKTSYWDEIPAWAKDNDGHCIVAYTGTIAFIVNKQKVKDIPTSWEDLKNGKALVTVGDVTAATQAQNAVLAAAVAYGGSETNLEPGIKYFEELAKNKRINLATGGLEGMQSGEVEVMLVWDFNALAQRDQMGADKDKWEIVIPSDGTITSGYTTFINNNAPHPYAAMLTREYILSDAGQINLARGYARPIRNVELPADVKAMLIDEEMYKNAKGLADVEGWIESSKNLPQIWQERVMVHFGG